jgi:hypothetical protein
MPPLMKSLAVAEGFSYFEVSVVKNSASGNSKIINSQIRPIMNIGKNLPSRVSEGYEIL